MAGDWDAPSLVDVLEAMARQVDTLVPPKVQWLRRIYEPGTRSRRTTTVTGPAAISPVTMTSRTTCSPRSWTSR